MEHSYSVIVIPVPPHQEQVSRYASLRLLALGTNPECFSSTKEREKSFSPEEWRERLSTTDRATFVALASEGSDKTPSTSLDHEVKWVGLVTVLSPEFVRSHRDQFPHSWSGGLAHILVSMWVHPEHRRKGVGKMLISQAVEWARSRNSSLEAELPDKSGVEGAEEKKTIMLEVSKDNVGATILYREMGFENMGDGEPHFLWMVKRLDGP